MVIDHANTLWLVLVNGYFGNPYLLTITTNGYVTVENGGLTNLSTSSGLCVDSANNLYYSGGNRVYRYTPDTGAVQAIAGNGNQGNFDGHGIARCTQPAEIRICFPLALGRAIE